jgi:hypothetical protein
LRYILEKASLSHFEGTLVKAQKNKLENWKIEKGSSLLREDLSGYKENGDRNMGGKVHIGEVSDGREEHVTEQ